ncbi:Cell wall alpha-1,3-glucan synthase ags1 [Puccinia graminis f. sp. tritici]|uniref:Cell wall alpha-1,3-glucan synthase ags1 n=1 Tax=Puccinia graminis f. sp. tritici TaxID=56615 RepID=A0A5B0QR95_PUCGR|nr:Cell wall alpha-1,3-glucan synthase ags1 [Puccinia graminis f. sp. tritici]
MILLQTLSRVHVAATLCLAQIIGSTARSSWLEQQHPIGSGLEVFSGPCLGNPNFHTSIPPRELAILDRVDLSSSSLLAGYFILFRREQLSKP